MKIKRLYIGDMGIYRNALMEDISPNIVVIGGLNRGGKTTLLEVLRHLVYGFPKNLRDTKVEYNVEGDLIDENNDNFTIRINGLKEPQVAINNEKSILTSSELYKGVDKFTYSKLFTISLDELRKSNIKEEEEKVKAILLGAGLEEVVKIPKLIENLAKSREKIGGKQGNPKIKLLKPHYDKLIKGIQEKDIALKQLEEYKEANKKLEVYKEEKEKARINEKQIENNLIILEVLKANYESYKDKIRLQLQLEQYNSKEYGDFEKYPSVDRLQAAYSEYLEALNSYERLKESTEQNISYEKIIKNKEKLIQLERNQSGLKQKMENYKLHKKQFEGEKENIVTKMNALNYEWRGDLSKLKSINCDFIEENKLLALVDEIKEYEEQGKRIKWEFEEQKSQEDRIKKELKTLKSSDLGLLMKRYLFISVLSILAGIGMLFVNRFIGASLSIVGVVLASFYAVSKYHSINGNSARKKALEIELNSAQNKIISLKERYAKIESNLKNLYANIEKYKKELGLNKEISAAALYTYFKAVQELQINTSKLEGKNENLEELNSEIIEELLNLNAFLELFYSMENSNVSRNNILDYSEELFSGLNHLATRLGKAEAYASEEKSYYIIREKTINLFGLEGTEIELLDKLYNKLEKYKEYNEYKALKTKLDFINRSIISSLSGNSLRAALDNNGVSSKELLENYDSLFEGYSSIEDINRQYKSYEEEVGALRRNLDSLNEKLQRVKIEMDSLKTSEKIQDAQKLIDDGRASLEPLALKYAVYSAAEYILTKVQKSFIDNAKDSLLSGASNILSKITSGEYKTILPGDNLLMSDFKTITIDNQEQNSYEALSRGTGEQIFLSVRFNRIKETEAKLPIILDDPFVNFDSVHTRNTLQVISELSSENQIFILTCHPEIVELSQETFEKAQYWRLEKGNFELTSSSNLISYLSKVSLP